MGAVPDIMELQPSNVYCAFADLILRSVCFRMSSNIEPHPGQSVVGRRDDHVLLILYPMLRVNDRLISTMCYFINIYV